MPIDVFAPIRPPKPQPVRPGPPPIEVGSLDEGVSNPPNEAKPEPPKK